MKKTQITAIAFAAVVLTVLGGMALAQQDKYTLKVPGGLAFSEFRGYEGWQVVGQSAKLKPDWLPDHTALPAPYSRMVCTACGLIGADVRPDWTPHTGSAGMGSARLALLRPMKSHCCPCSA